MQFNYPVLLNTKYYEKFPSKLAYIATVYAYTDYQCNLKSLSLEQQAPTKNSRFHNNLYHDLVIDVN